MNTNDAALNHDTSVALEMANVSKHFLREVAVHGLNFKIPRGIIIGLIGPSGCGKTTTVRLSTGIYSPSEGEVRLLGLDPRRFNPYQRQLMGYMTQLFTLYPDLTVGENMNFAASLYGIGFSRGKRIRQLLDFVELSPSSNKLARNISGGMQRRLALAATLVHDPALLFLDEPTAGIDPILRRKFWDHFQELRNSGKTVFVTTQYVNEAAYCDLVGIMSDGQLLSLESPDNLRRLAYGGDILDLKPKAPIPYANVREMEALEGIIAPIQAASGGRLRILVQEGATALPMLVNWMNEKGIAVETLEEVVPPFDDVFVKVIQDFNNRNAALAQEGRQA